MSGKFNFAKLQQMKRISESSRKKKASAKQVVVEDKTPDITIPEGLSDEQMKMVLQALNHQPAQNAHAPARRVSTPKDAADRLDNKKKATKEVENMFSMNATDWMGMKFAVYQNARFSGSERYDGNDAATLCIRALHDHWDSVEKQYKSSIKAKKSKTPSGKKSVVRGKGSKTPKQQQDASPRQ